MAAWVPIVTAFVAAVTASIGYFLTDRAKLIERRQETYARALLAVHTYKKLPYRIRRRTDDTAETRASLGTLISDVERDLDYFNALLDLDAPDVARRFRALAAKVRQQGTAQREAAWGKPPIASATDMAFSDSYPIDDQYQQEACQEAMRRHLKVLPTRRLRASRDDRSRSTPPAAM